MNRIWLKGIGVLLQVGTPRRRRPLKTNSPDGAARRPYLAKPLKKLLALAMVAGSVCVGASAQTAVVTHAELQAVTTNGMSAWETNFPFTIRGVIVADAMEMLDSAFKPDATTPPTGGQFQIFIQAAEEGDRGGTVLYMGQRSILGDHYDETAWSNEMRRVMFDASGRKFRKGDLVEVTARKALPYYGKLNINEAHRTTVSNNFDIALVKANVGLPQAETITLTDLVDTNGVQIFDVNRALGGEKWQGMRVRLDGIRLVNTNGWGKTNWTERICTAADTNGLNFTLRMPLTDLGDPPATSSYVSAVGILNEEDSTTNGYKLFVQEIGPVLSVGTNIVGSLAVSFSSDYEGYTLEASDDGFKTWSPVDITPVKVIVIEDDSDSPNRAYRLRKVD